jgi:hypothetical protein
MILVILGRGGVLLVWELNGTVWQAIGFILLGYGS